MRTRIEIRLMTPAGPCIWASSFPLAPDGEEEPDLRYLEDEQLTELVLGRVRDYVTHELL